MRRWFTSDQHFGHANILGYCRRPFASLDEMHDELVRRHNERVGQDDEVWHLGDFSLDQRYVKSVLPRLHGRHRLIVGNHDAAHPTHRRAAHEMPRYLAAGFEVVMERCILSTSFGRAFLCHLPLDGAGDSGPEERYPAWRPTRALLDEAGCDVLLHGHVHEAYDRLLVCGIRCFNVGVDVRGFRPIDEQEIAAELKSWTLDRS